MSANGTRTIIWQGGEDAFCLAKVGLIFDLEEKCRAGIGLIYARLASGSYFLNDVRETIRLGLIGAGATPEKAMASVKNNVDANENGLAPSILVALAVLEAVLVGVPDDPVGKSEPAGAQETGSTTTTDASDALKSSASAAPSSGPPERPSNRRSGK
jgi:hypothetical protein